MATQAINNFDYLQRQEVDTKVQDASNIPQVPLGMVNSPRGIYPHYQRTDAATQGLSALAGAVQGYAEKKEKQDFVNGQMLALQGKTWEDLQQSGENDGTLRGFTTMQSVSYASEMYQRMQNEIKNGSDAMKDPRTYVAELNEMFKGVLTGNEYTDGVATALAADIMPKLAAQQLEANSAWRSAETFNAYRDMLVQAGLSKDTNIMSFINPGDVTKRVLGLNEVQQREAVTQAVELSLAQGSDSVARAIGLNTAPTMSARDSRRGTPSIQVPADYQRRVDPELDATLVKAVQRKNSGVYVYQVPLELARAVMWRESRGQDGRYSPAGAYGPMQLMPITAKDVGVDRMDPVQNIHGGVEYLHRQLQEFGGNQVLSLIAYNWGPKATKDWLQAGADVRAVPQETQTFVRDILGIDISSGQTVRTGSAGDALLNKGYSSAQQERMLKAHAAALRADASAWSADLQLRVNDVVQNVQNGALGYDAAMEKLFSIPGLSESMLKSGMASVMTASGRADSNILLEPQTYHAVTQIIETVGTTPESYNEHIALLTDALKDQSPSVQTSFMKDLQKQYSANLKAMYGDEESLPESVYSEQELMDISRVASLYRTAATSPNTDVVGAWSTATAELEMLAKQYNWTNDERVLAESLIGDDRPASATRIETMLRDAVYSREKLDATLGKGLRAAESGTMYTLNADERRKTYKELDKRLQDMTIRQLNDTIGPNWSPAEYTEAYGINKAIQLNKQGPEAIDEVAKDEFRGLMTEPAVTGAGENTVVDSVYMTKYKSARHLMDINPTLAEKYLGSDVFALVEDIRRRDEGESSTDSAIMKAFAQRDSSRTATAKDIKGTINTEDFKLAIQEQIPEQILQQFPSTLERMFASPGTQDYAVTVEQVARASADPSFQRYVSEAALTVKANNPALSDEAVAKTAVAQALNNHSFVAGNMLRGSSGNGGDLLKDMGIPPELATPHAANHAFMMFMNDMIKITPEDHEMFGRGKVSPIENWTHRTLSATVPPYAAVNLFTSLGREMSDVVTNVSGTPEANWINWSILYNPGTQTLVATMVGNEDYPGAIGQEFVLDARAIGAHYVEKVNAVYAQEGAEGPSTLRRLTDYMTQGGKEYPDMFRMMQ